MAGGSNTTASLCNAIASVCNSIRRKLGIADGQSVGDALCSRSAIEEYLEYQPAGAKPDGVAALAKGQLQFAGGTQGDKLRFAFRRARRQRRVDRVADRVGSARLRRTLRLVVGGPRDRLSESSGRTLRLPPVSMS